uniref:Uncharacterized protein n=1 Tax=Oryza glumipatula TaxID=40148 RepID=A0A0E0BUR9_9ORYZ
MASMVSKNSPPATARHEDGGEGGTALTVTSCLYLHRPEPGAGALDKDAVLRRIRHRRRANRLRESLQSLLLTQQQQAAPPPETAADKGRERLAWLDDAFSSP